MPKPFQLLKDTAPVQLPFGVIRKMCDPANMGAKHLVIIDARFPENQGHSFHRHPEQEEVIYVIEGRIEQWVGSEKCILGPGDVAFIKPDQVHASFNVGTGEARIVAIFGPSVGESGATTVDVYDQAPWKDMRKG
jgi:quercetin dioxygenase-like cupin family protein